MLALTAALLAGSGVCHAEKAVIVVSPDGVESTAMTLQSLSRFDISAEGVVLKGTDGTTASFKHEQIGRILIGADWVGISNSLAAGEIAIWPSETTGPLNVAGLQVGDKVSVYSLAGALAASTTASADCNVTLDLSQLASGMYIVKAGKASVKILKK